ncbi:ATP synthase subunit beta [Frankliniella fusca]|uniref:ATP synthase subunit beta n=1 Tax=Frankliniella fusca TaxID=407009 RepID=A0AAE1H7M4_9NEOP|nr:ATP synthase subunit beta [Frankliniella fusca]
MVRPQRGSNPSSSSSSARRAERALVKWVEGAHANQITPDVDLDWIIGIDAASPEFPETYAIEWRVPPRPRNGWPVYDGLVMDISSDLDYLKSRAQELEQQRGDSRSDSDSAGSSGSSERSCSAGSSGSSERSCSSQKSGSNADSNPLDVNSDALRQLLQSLVTQGSLNTRKSPHKSSSTPPSEEKVCVGKSLWVSSQIYSMAANAPSPGRMVRPLLRQAFSRRRLIKSSYAGQRRKKDGTMVVKPGLKKYQKMADIHAFVLKKFPHMSQASFGATVNSFLGEKPNVIHHMEYVEESEESASEEDN